MMKIVAFCAVTLLLCRLGECGNDGQGSSPARSFSFSDSNTNCPSTYLLPVIQDAAQYASGAQNQNNYIYNRLRSLYPQNNYVIDVIQQGVEWYANTYHCNNEQCRYDTSSYVYLVYRSSGSCCNM